MKVNIRWCYDDHTKRHHVSKDWKITDNLKRQRDELLSRVGMYQSKCREAGNKVPKPLCIWISTSGGCKILDYTATKTTGLLQWVFPKPNQFN
jgi:hypothetical protein